MITPDRLALALLLFALGCIAWTVGVVLVRLWWEGAPSLGDPRFRPHAPPDTWGYWWCVACWLDWAGGQAHRVSCDDDTAGPPPPTLED